MTFNKPSHKTLRTLPLRENPANTEPEVQNKLPEINDFDIFVPLSAK
jgi:hypothetical protein